MRKHQLYRSAFSAALLGMTIAPSVLAEEPGFTLGVDYGRAEARKFCDNITDCDNSDNSPKVEIGYAFNQNFSAELGYTSFGTLMDSSDSTFAVSEDAHAVTLSVVGALPLNEIFAIYARGGIAWYETDNSGDVLGVPVEDDDGTTPFLGAGLKWTATESFAVRLEYQNYMDISRADGNEDDVHGVYAGILFQL